MMTTMSVGVSLGSSRRLFEEWKIKLLLMAGLVGVDLDGVSRMSRMSSSPPPALVSMSSMKNSFLSIFVEVELNCLFNLFQPSEKYFSIFFQLSTLVVSYSCCVLVCGTMITGRILTMWKFLL